MASKKEYSFKFDLRTKGGKAAAQMFGDIAKAMERTSKASYRTSTEVKRLSTQMELIAKSMATAKKGAQQTASSLAKIASSQQIQKLHDLSNIMQQVGQYGQIAANKIFGGFKKVYGSLFEIGTTFQYIKGGMDFAFGRKAEQTMMRSLDIAQQTNISTREVLDVTRSLGVLKINPFSDMMTKKGEIQSAMKSLSDLAALVPQQGMQGAMFAIRNALSGQWRSLQMRFDLPLNIIDQIRGKIEKTMSTQERFDTIIQGITDKFGGLMKSVEGTSKFVLDNIKDVMTNLAYDVFKESIEKMTPFFNQIFEYLKAIRKDEKTIEKLAKVFNSLTKTFITLAKFVFFIAKGFAEMVKTFPGLIALITKGGLVLGVFFALFASVTLAGTGIMMLKANFIGLTGSIRLASLSATGFGLAMKTALISTGIGVFLVILGTVISKLMTATKKAQKLQAIQGGFSNADYTGEATEAQLAYHSLAKYSKPGGMKVMRIYNTPAFKDVNGKFVPSQERRFFSGRPSDVFSEKNLKPAFTRIISNYKSRVKNQSLTAEEAQKDMEEKYGISFGKGGDWDKPDWKTTKLLARKKFKTADALEKSIGEGRDEIGFSAKSLLSAQSVGSIGAYGAGEWNQMRTDYRNNYINERVARKRKALKGLLENKGKTKANYATAKIDMESYLAGTTSGESMQKKYKLSTAQIDMLGKGGTGYGSGLFGLTGSKENPQSTLLNSILGTGSKSLSTLILKQSAKGEDLDKWITEMYRFGVDFGDDAGFGTVKGSKSGKKMTADDKANFAKKIQAATEGDTGKDRATLIKDALLSTSKDEDLWYNIWMLLKENGKLLEEGNANTEDIAGATLSTQELLPPIFREIFDQFTRRTILSQGGRMEVQSRLSVGTQ